MSATATPFDDDDGFLFKERNSSSISSVRASATDFGDEAARLLLREHNDDEDEDF